MKIDENDPFSDLTDEEVTALIQKTSQPKETKKDKEREEKYAKQRRPFRGIGM